MKTNGKHPDTEHTTDKTKKRFANPRLSDSAQTRRIYPPHSSLANTHTHNNNTVNTRNTETTGTEYRINRNRIIGYGHSNYHNRWAFKNNKKMVEIRVNRMAINNGYSGCSQKEGARDHFYIWYAFQNLKCQRPKSWHKPNVNTLDQDAIHDKSSGVTAKMITIKLCLVEREREYNGITMHWNLI